MHAAFLGFVLVALLSTVQSEVEVEPKAFPSIAYHGYHDKYGIPLAKKIKEAEDAFFEQQGNVNGSRIVGGTFAPVNAYPYLGGLLITLQTGGTSACGSCLVSANRLVTAAHCWNDGVRDAVEVQVVLGSQFLFHGGGTRVRSSTVVVHPGWTPATLADDVAIIYLPVRVAFSQAIQPVALPTGSLIRESFAGWWARAAGYGRTSDLIPGINQGAQISHVNLQVITMTQCQATFGTTFVIDSTICTSGAGGVGVCNGDSGGPLVVMQNGQNILVGVSSFVARAGCEQGFPSAYARVTSFTNWILQHMW